VDEVNSGDDSMDSMNPVLQNTGKLCRIKAADHSKAVTGR